ncbi:MAG: addiction module protein [Proteobacteria bacterium]|nr:addiction module protein [Pseudomonadota bacterium]
MKSDINHILEEAMELSPAEKAELVTSLLSSIDEPDREIDAQWQKEVEDRVKAHKRGEIKARSLQEVLAKYR